MYRRILSLFVYTVAVLCLSTASFAQVRASITIAPPELPTYEQPLCPGDGYIWTPGYWAWDDDYYWVPGTWVMPPQVGVLWTPGYWGWGTDGYVFNEGYWGSSVGFYGGIDYGFGYFGHGYEGGRWDRGHFFYNTAWNRVNTSLTHNVYTARNGEGAGTHVSFNGGSGGITARASAQEEAAGHERHLPPAAAQVQHAWTARSTPQQRYTTNHGAPQVIATARPNTAVHPRDLPPIERAAPPHTGNPQQDQKYQQDQERLVAQQTRDRQNLQQKQDQELQQRARQANAQRAQQVEQQHQRQTQQLQQRHTQQTQHMQQKQQPQAGGGGGSGRDKRR